MFKVYYKIPFCYLSLHSNGDFLTKIDFCDRLDIENTCPLLEFAKEELRLYFAKSFKNFKHLYGYKGVILNKKYIKN